MPNNDRTGPNGMGSRTGRGAGLCNGNEPAGSGNNMLGSRTGRGKRGQRSGRGQSMGLGQGGQRMGGGRLRGISVVDESSGQNEQQTQSQIDQLQQQIDSLKENLKQPPSK